MSRSRRGSWARTRRATPLNGLVTQSETMISSQASVVSSHRTQDWEGDFEDFEDMVGEQGDQLRITPEEESRIQGVLQLARKGKINSNNAFEVPVRVADPQLGEGRSLRFWKFASELLMASMGIYDKRVEHLFLGTHRMFDALLRTPSQSVTDESQQQRSQQLPQPMSVKEGEHLSGYELGSLHCEQAAKLNSRGAAMQFRTDPLFSKKLQAFDSDSLKCLFLNVFETGSRLQITFFNESQPLQQTHRIGLGQAPGQPSISHISEEEQQSTRTTFSSGETPLFLTQEYHKLALLARTQDSFQCLSTFRQENQRSNLLDQGQQEDWKLDIQDWKLDMEEPHNDIPQLSQFTQYSEDLPVPDYEEESTQAASEGFGSHYFLSNQLSDFSSEEMTPWGLQFKGLRLQRRKRKGQRRRNKEVREKKEDLQIDFLDVLPLRREEVFQAKPTKAGKSSKTPPFNRFLLPIQLDHKHFYWQKTPQVSQKQHSTTFLSFQSKEDPPTTDYEWPAEKEEPESTEPVSWGLSHLSQWSQNMGNVREVKERVAVRVGETGSILLSELCLGLSGSNAFVVALHLANEMRVELGGLESGSDVELRAI